MSGTEFLPLPSNPDENASSRIIASTVAVTTLAFITVSTRFYVRTALVKALGWDDFFMALAMVVSIATQVVVILAVHHGAGQHIGDVPLATYAKGIMYNYIAQGLLLWGICLVKLSVGYALLRIAARKSFKMIIISIMVFMTVYTIACFVSNFFFCERISMIWDFGGPRKCWSPETLSALAFTHAGLNIITDIAFAVAIPVPMLWKLQTNRSTKAAILAVLALGLFVCMAGIIRIPEILNFGKQGDFLWSNKDFMIWFMAEMNTGIIAGSIPSLKPLFKSIIDKTYALTTRRSPKNTIKTEQSISGTAGSYRLKPLSKRSSNLQDLERQDSYAQIIDDADAASQRKLVPNGDLSRTSPLGTIEKSVTTTVVSMPDPETYRSTQRREW